MRPATAILPVLLVSVLVSLAFLPNSFAQPRVGSTAEYLPAVFKFLPSPTSTSTPTVLPTGTVQASPTATSTSAPQGFPTVGAGTPTRTPVDRPIFTSGRDVWNCSDFGTWNDANIVYQANLPDDPNKLDQDADGIPCETLPGAP